METDHRYLRHPKTENKAQEEAQLYVCVFVMQDILAIKMQAHFAQVSLVSKHWPSIPPHSYRPTHKLKHQRAPPPTITLIPKAKNHLLEEACLTRY